ncbi:MAG: leucine-rich repeat protein [Treponematales bacterium]
MRQSGDTGREQVAGSVGIIGIKQKLRGNNKPLVLYKYRTLQQFLEHFDDYMAGNLWFADKTSLNDPMEYAPLPDRLIPSQQPVGQGEYSLDDYFETLQQSDDLEKLKEKKGPLQELLSPFKILSLSKSASNLAMWTYYADEHKGVCLGYEINPAIVPIGSIRKKEATGEQIVRADVQYNDVIPVVEYNGNITWGNIEKLFCYKLESWRYEEECRLLVSGEAGLRPIGKLSAIVLGYQCPLVIDKIFTKEQQRDLVRRVEYENPAGRGWRLYVPESDKPHLGKFADAVWEYEETKEGITILGYRGSQPEVKIPCDMHGKPVVAIGDGAFFLHVWLTKVTIPDSVSTIGKGTFSSGLCLTTVNIPKSVKIIESNTFRGCWGLTAMIIPDGVTAIGVESFSGCKGLTIINIPESVKTIEAGAFKGCTGLATVTIPDSVTEIGEGAFAGCTGLATVTIPDGETKIEKMAFHGCIGLDKKIREDIRKRFGDGVL